jgi:hypothetical protein
MLSTPSPENRRSRRLLQRTPVYVCGVSPTGTYFREEALAVSFNAHGALLLLYTPVALDQKLLLLHPTTWDEQPSRVVSSVPSHMGLSQVGIEFCIRAPHFWPVVPPEDWHLKSPHSTQSSPLNP